MRLSHCITRAARVAAARTATTFADRSRSWAELADRVARLAAALLALGVRPGDRVAFFGSNSDRYLEWFFGVGWAGAVLVPINARLARPEVEDVMNHCGAGVLFADDDFAPAVHDMRDELGHVPELVHAGEGTPPGKTRSAGQAALGVEVAILDANGSELPRGQVGEICARGDNVMLGYWNQPELTQETLRDGWLHTGDAGYIDEDGYVFVVDRLKDMVIVGASNVYTAEVENAIAQHPAVAESAIIGIPTEQCGEQVHAIVALRDGRELAPDELIAHCRDLIAVRGPQVMDGYFDDPDATAATLTVDGWLGTGDLVAIRPDGQLVIEDRLKELIKVRGASVAPAELELVLCEHPSVRDAAVVGRPAAGHGEVPVAYVVPSGPAGSEELISFVAARVAPYKRLHEVSFVATLPRMPSGKLLRQRLCDTHPTERSDTA